MLLNCKCGMRGDIFKLLKPQRNVPPSIIHSILLLTASNLQTAESFAVYSRVSELSGIFTTTTLRATKPSSHSFHKPPRQPTYHEMHRPSLSTHRFFNSLARQQEFEASRTQVHKLVGDDWAHSLPLLYYNIPSSPPLDRPSSHHFPGSPGNCPPT